MDSSRSSNNSGRWGPPPQKSAPPPPPSAKSNNNLLGNLLSSSQRSAQQTDRYRMQAARPFADSSQIGQAAKRANAAYNRQLGIELLPKKKSVDIDNNTNGMTHERTTKVVSFQNSDSKHIQQQANDDGSTKQCKSAPLPVGSTLSFLASAMGNNRKPIPANKAPSPTLPLPLPPPVDNNNNNRITTLGDSKCESIQHELSKKGVTFGSTLFIAEEDLKQSQSNSSTEEEPNIKRKRSRWDVRPKVEMPSSTSTTMNQSTKLSSSYMPEGQSNDAVATSGAPIQQQRQDYESSDTNKKLGGISHNQSISSSSMRREDRFIPPIQPIQPKWHGCDSSETGVHKNNNSPGRGSAYNQSIPSSPPRRREDRFIPPIQKHVASPPRRREDNTSMLQSRFTPPKKDYQSHKSNKISRQYHPSCMETTTHNHHDNMSKSREVHEQANVSSNSATAYPRSSNNNHVITQQKKEEEKEVPAMHSPIRNVNHLHGSGRPTSYIEEKKSEESLLNNKWFNDNHHVPPPITADKSTIPMAIPKKKKKKRKIEDLSSNSNSNSSPTKSSSSQPKFISFDPPPPSPDEDHINSKVATKAEPSSSSLSVQPKFISFDPPPCPDENPPPTTKTKEKKKKKKKRKKKKELRPFRVKVGCIVAIRFRKLDAAATNGGNKGIIPVVKIMNDDGDDNALSYQRVMTDETATTKKKKSQCYEVWADPIPGQDDGLSLLGSWISCIFQKSFVADWQTNNGDVSSSLLGHVIEGSVISIIGNDDDSESTHDRGGISVHLLVDRWAAKSLPYLPIVSSNVNEDDDDASLSTKEQQWREREAKIRGENNIIVKVTLASTFDQANNNDSKQLESGIASWAIRKRVHAKPTGKKEKKEKKHHKHHVESLYVGDGNDTKSQQKKNWTWIAGRASSEKGVGTTGHSSSLESNTRDLTPQIFGEVVNITRSAPDENSTSLATVTIKRILTPEQLPNGRLPHHGTMELFDVIPTNCNNELDFQAPVEDMVVVGKRINRLVDAWKQPNLEEADGSDAGWTFTITHSYDADDNTYMPLSGSDTFQKESMKTCNCCQRCYHDSQLQKFPDLGDSYRCARCLEGAVSPSTTCQTVLPSITFGSDINQAFSGLVEPLRAMTTPIDFTLPISIGQLSLRPSLVPNTGGMKSKSYIKEIPEVDIKKERKEDKKRAGKNHENHRRKDSSATIKKTKKKDSARTKTKPPPKKKVKTKKGSSTEGGKAEKVKVVKPKATKPKATKPKAVKPKPKVSTVVNKKDDEPECHRAVPFDQLKKVNWGSSKLKLALSKEKEPSFRENARPRIIRIGKDEETTNLTGRAARASQRRIVKSFAAFGDAKVDRLAGRDREKQLRFDKSKIHGWGVFAEAPITAGDLIIEYRGELIGNAVADKRELEYERNKMDDYMFRIDKMTVCDATILGNVARYINASCTPNCYTQIITAGENKRIVIYAKKDIMRGEELCYDYMFAHEFNATKRILCTCGSRGCSGFLNWVSVCMCACGRACVCIICMFDRTNLIISQLLHYYCRITNF